MITITELRNDLYNKIDSVIATGVPIEIERKGHAIQIIRVDTENATIPKKKVKKQSKWSRLTPHPDCIVGDPDDIIYINWSDYGAF